MSNHGKKFTAAEKHFHEKEVIYQRRIKVLQERNIALAGETIKLQKELEGYEDLKVRYAKLLELSKLSESELTAVIKEAEHIKSLKSLLTLGAYSYS